MMIHDFSPNGKRTAAPDDDIDFRDFDDDLEGAVATEPIETGGWCEEECDGPVPDPQPEANSQRAKPPKPKQSKARKTAAEAGTVTARPSAASMLVQLAHEAELELFHTPDQFTFASIPVDDHFEVWPLRSENFRNRMRRWYYLKHGKAVGSEALKDALGILDGEALYDGPEHATPVRLAEDQGRIYLDLGDPDWQVVEIDAQGWRVHPGSPIRFRRPRGLLPLPVPEQGGSLEELRRFINVGADSAWKLLVGFLVQTLRPRGPYPILCLSGQHGAAKSTTDRILRHLIDPYVAPLRKEPREDRDLLIAANNSWLLAFDNLSSIPSWLSDALCRLSTGGGFATRQLYSDSDEVLFDAMRPCVLTSIEDLATRGDLLDRGILIDLPPIPDSQRRPERTFWPEFTAARPRILGGLLDAVSAALRRLPTVQLPCLPRMADFAEWVTAAEPALGWDEGSFLGVYQGNREGANDLALEADVIVPPLMKLLAKTGHWSGNATELLQALVPLAGDLAARDRGWPRRPNALVNRLRRLAPNLLAAGYQLTRERQAGGRRARVIRLSRIEQEQSGETSSHTVPPSQTDAEHGENAGGPRRSGTIHDPNGTIPGTMSGTTNAAENPHGTMRDDLSHPDSNSPENVDDSRVPGLGDAWEPEPAQQRTAKELKDDIPF
jgi:hypothetical protein